MSIRWCGVTSAVTFQPLPLAQRRISTDPAVETWQTCSREPTCPASSASRAMIASSAAAGQPVRPSRPDTTPSFSCAPTVSRGSSACWAMTPPNALTYSSARRISAGSDTHAPSSEKTRTWAAESAIAPSSASCVAGPPDGDRADRLHVDQPGLAAQPPDLLDHAGGVGGRIGVGHGEHRGVATERGGRGAGLDRLGVLAARARAGGCAGRPDPGSSTSPPPSMTSAASAADRATDRGDDPVRRSATSTASSP